MAVSEEEAATLISFVKLIENNPCLWNYTLKTYSRTDLTGLAWKKIETETKDTEPNCRDRWKNIHTAYGRSLKPPKSGSGRSKKPYYLAAHLSFLRPYMKGTSSSGNITEETEIDDDGKEEANDSQTTSEIPNLQEDDEFSNIVPAVDTEAEIVVPLQPKRKKATPQQQQEEQLRNDANNAFVEWVAMKKQSVRKTEKDQEKDSDWLFLMSLLPDMKKLDDKRRRTVKMKIMQFINKQLDEAERETSTPFSPWDSSMSSSAHYPISISVPTTLNTAQPTQCQLNPSTYIDL